MRRLPYHQKIPPLEPLWAAIPIRLGVAGQVHCCCFGGAAYFERCVWAGKGFYSPLGTSVEQLLQEAGQNIQQSSSEWRKGSDVDIWLHLLSLHAAVVMLIRERELAQQMLLSWREH